VTALEGWAIADIGFGVALGVLVGVVYMLVRITTNGKKDE
jgi:hypothetical protein